MSAGGRPTQYDPSMCQIAYDYLYEGGLMSGVARKLGVVKSTIYEWMNTHPEFSDAIKLGQEMSLAWWEELPKANLHNKDFNNVLFFMTMKNKGGWVDKIEQNIDMNANVSIADTITASRNRVQEIDEK